jgi:hypothetical protein
MCVRDPPARETDPPLILKTTATKAISASQKVINKFADKNLIAAHPLFNAIFCIFLNAA